MAVPDESSLVVLGKIQGRTTLTRYELPSGETLDSVLPSIGARGVVVVTLAGKLCLAVSYAHSIFDQIHYG